MSATRVAYLGPLGTFSHMAARIAFGDAADYLPSTTIASVFDDVQAGTADRGIVPIENSSGGGVTMTLDSLLDHEVQIEREVFLDVSQCLMAQGNTLAGIERVHSHPQAIAQSRHWLRQHLPDATIVAEVSTSLAAVHAAKDPAIAAVASELSAELNGLQLIARSIQDQAENQTRFLVISPKGAPGTQPTGSDRTSLAFRTVHQCGALRQVLAVFDEHQINLTHIESRPSGTRWEYVFLVDLEGHRLDPSLAAALQELSTHCSAVRVFGSYPRG
jgi:chorismate mutase / prephenate dehydratase